MDYLSSREIDILQKFIEDQNLKDIVKKVLLRGIYDNGTLKPDQPAKPLQNFALLRVITAINKGEDIDTAKIGQDLWTSASAISLIEDGFQQIEKLKKVEEIKKETKPKYR